VTFLVSISAPAHPPTLPHVESRGGPQSEVGDRGLLENSFPVTWAKGSSDKLTCPVWLGEERRTSVCTPWGLDQRVLSNTACRSADLSGSFNSSAPLHSSPTSLIHKVDNMGLLTVVEDRPTPKAVYNWRVWACACVASFASCMIGYDR